MRANKPIYTIVCYKEEQKIHVKNIITFFNENPFNKWLHENRDEIFNIYKGYKIHESK